MKFIKNSNCLLLIMIFGIKVYLNVKINFMKFKFTFNIIIIHFIFCFKI